MSHNWVARVAEDTRINELAIPGTHDAAAWTHNNSTSPPGTWAQRKSITEQLDLGIRVLDLRVGWSSMFSSASIAMFHGPIPLGLSLQEVLTDVKNWLGQKEHSKEFVVLIFQQQGKFSNADLANAVKDMVRTTFGAAQYQVANGLGSWPTVGKLRGKVLVMGRLKSEVQGFCNVRSWLDEGDNTDGVVIEAGRSLRIFLQDKYKELSKKIGSTGGYQSMDGDNRLKFDVVKAAATEKPDVLPAQLLRINHMSYSNLRYQPWQSGEGVNALLRGSTFKIQGVLMIDDADQATVDHILANKA